MRRLGLICACYVLISGILFLPLLRDFNGVVTAGSDSHFLIWNMWWVHEGMHKPGQSLLWTGYQYHPTGTSLLMQPLDLAQIAWVWPIYSYWGPIAANSTIVFFSFFLTGFCAFLLVRKLGVSDGPAFVGGLIFMMCPFHLAHIQSGHTSLATLHWLPLFCMALILWWKKPGVWPGILLTLTLLVIFYTNWYMTACALVFTICWSGVRLWERPAVLLEKRRWLALLPALVIGAAGAGPILIPAILHRGKFDEPAQYVPYSADLLSFFVPGGRSAWNGLTSLWQGFSGNVGENGNYLGFVTLALAAFGLRFCRDRRYWVVLLLVALTLSLGPYLHVNGRWEFSAASLGPLRAPAEWTADTTRRLNPNWCITPGHVAVPLPYLVLKEIPLFSTARVPARFMPLAFLALAVIAAFGAENLLRRFGALGRTIGLAALISLVVVEFCPRLSFVQPEADPFFSRLAEMPGDFAIVDCSPFGRRIYHQMIHQKKIVGGYVGRVEIESLRVFCESGVDAWLDDGRAMEQDPRPTKNWLVSIGVRFVVVPSTSDAVRRQLDEAGFPRVYESDRLIVYECRGTAT